MAGFSAVRAVRLFRNQRTSNPRVAIAEYHATR